MRRIPQILLEAARHVGAGTGGSSVALGRSAAAASAAVANATEANATEANTTVRNATDICVVAMNNGPIRELGQLVRTFVEQRGELSPRFNIVINGSDAERDAIMAVFHEHGWENVDLVVLDTNLVKKRLEEIHAESHHHSGIAGLAKSFISEFFPEVERCILVDTDVLLVAPLADFDAVFDNFTEHQLMAATWRDFLPFGDRINTGVVVHHFGHQRRQGWSEALSESHSVLACQSMSTGPVGFHKGRGSVNLKWADQDLIHAALMVYDNLTDTTVMPPGLLRLDRRWNNEMCRDFNGICDTPRDTLPGLLHFNCGMSEAAFWCTESYRKWKEGSCLGEYLHGVPEC